MRLFEVLTTTPSVDPNMAATFSRLDKVTQSRILQKYKIQNLANISALPQQRQLDVAHDIQYLSSKGNGVKLGTVEPQTQQDTPVQATNPFQPQAGYNPGDEQRYPPTSPYRRQGG